MAIEGDNLLQRYTQQMAAIRLTVRWNYYCERRHQHTCDPSYSGVWDQEILDHLEDCLPGEVERMKHEGYAWAQYNLGKGGAGADWVDVPDEFVAAFVDPKPQPCKICGNTPDEDGMLEHGRGCYKLNSDGGGTEYVGRDS